MLTSAPESTLGLKQLRGLLFNNSLVSALSVIIYGRLTHLLLIKVLLLESNLRSVDLVPWLVLSTNCLLFDCRGGDFTILSPTSEPLLKQPSPLPW